MKDSHRKFHIFHFNCNFKGLELLVERSLTNCSIGMTPGESLRRVLECVSSGVLLPSKSKLFYNFSHISESY
jgi:hypothetical protein